MDEEILPSVAQTETDLAPDAIEESDSNETETVEELKVRLADEAEKRQKADELANNYKIRAEKAEKKVEKNAPIIKESKSALSSKDMIALMNAKVHEDDVDEVLDYAKYKGIPVSEALKSGILKASLSEKSELRDTANATNTAKTRTAGSRVSGENLLDKATKTGELPDTGDALNALLDARYASKKK